MRDSSATDMGISDIPMQLLIGACVIAFAAPIFYSAYDDLSSTITISEVADELSELLDSMELLISADPGSRLQVELEFKGFGSVNVEEVSIGGPLAFGPERFLIEYRLSDGYFEKFTLDPPFPIVTVDNSTMSLSEGKHELMITYVDSNIEDHIRIEYI
jgi:hypothetical protein